MIELDTIYNEDCLEGMKRIPDGSIDMILCDLPYGTTYAKWDIKIPFELLWAEYLRIIKVNGVIALFGQMPFSAEIVMSNPKMFRYEWVWEKGKATGFFNAKKMPMKCHEQILIFYKSLPAYTPQFDYRTPYTRKSSKVGGQGIYRGKEYVMQAQNVTDGRRYPRDIIKFDSDKKTTPPTQKPVALCEYIIKTYTNEGQIVLDNCIGSGTTAVAAINTGRRFIGFEKDKGYFDIAQKRIAAAKEEIAQRFDFAQ